MSALSKAKTNQETEITEMLSGLQSTLPSTVKTISVVGKVQTPAQVEAQLQSFLTVITAVATAKAAYAKAVANRQTLDLGMEALMVGLRSFLRQMFPGDAVTLAKFGIDLTVKTKASSLKKATTATKATATREKHKAPVAQPESQVLLFDANGNPINAPPSMTPSSTASTAPTSAAPAAGSSGSAK